MPPRLEQIQFARPAVAAWAAANPQYTLWPVVYMIDGRATRIGARDIYIGETSTVFSRLQQDLKSAEKQHLRTITIIVDDTFNRSVCLDLQAYLIRMLAGDGSYRVLNRNIEVIESNYPQRDTFRAMFRFILSELARKGMFTRTSHKIEISDLYKLSPFKTLTDGQAACVCDMVSQLLRGLTTGSAMTLVLQGDPGTGKTVVAIFLLKLLVDIQCFTSLDDFDDASIFYDFFTEDNKTLLKDLRLGLVIPQQSLRKSATEVFKRTAGLHKDMIMTAFKLGQSEQPYDIVLVDETHRLNQRASQPSPKLNADFANININLFGSDDKTKTQLDWVKARSRHQIFLVDTAQGVLPADLPAEVLSNLLVQARAGRHHFQLHTQMRIQAGSDFVAYIRTILDPTVRHRQHIHRTFPGYDFRIFDDLATMRNEIFLRDGEVGLSRLVAGYAWEWKSKANKEDYDIEVGAVRLRWNGEVTDWVSSPNSLEEVGSVHTIQGYDLNYVGVIIGRDLRYNLARQELWFSRTSYHDTRGKANNHMLKKTYTDADLLKLVTQIYAILLTRGIRGTYVYVCDPELRQYLRAYIPAHNAQQS